MKKILTLGSATQDIFINCSSNNGVQQKCLASKNCLVIQEGEKIEIESLVYASGGGATNSAASFARLGFQASCFFKAGKDSQADFIIEDLVKHCVTPHEIITTQEEATGTSFIMPSIRGNNSVLTYRGANATLQNNEIPYHTFKQFDALYLTSLSGASALQYVPIIEEAKKQGLFIANNPGTSQLKSAPELIKKALQHLDIFILNAHEARTLYETWQGVKHPIHAEKNLLCLFMQTTQGTITLRDFFREILQSGPQIAVVTNGSEGVYVATKESIIFCQAPKIIAQCSVGAGDGFGSTFTASILRNYSPRQAAQFGAITGASVIQKQGAKAGLLSFEQLQKAQLPQKIEEYSW